MESAKRRETLKSVYICGGSVLQYDDFYCMAPCRNRSVWKRKGTKDGGRKHVGRYHLWGVKRETRLGMKQRRLLGKNGYCSFWLSFWFFVTKRRMCFVREWYLHCTTWPTRRIDESIFFCSFVSDRRREDSCGKGVYLICLIMCRRAFKAFVALSALFYLLFGCIYRHTVFFSSLLLLCSFFFSCLFLSWKGGILYRWEGRPFVTCSLSFFFFLSSILQFSKG